MRRLAVILLLMPLTLGAQELRVLSGGAAKSLVEPLASSFPRAKVEVRFQPMGPLVESLAASHQGGAAVDLVIVTEETLPRLERQNLVKPGAKPIARVGIGVAVNEKAPLPDIATADALRRTLLAAKSVVYIDPKVGTSGKHVAAVLERLGIAAEVNAKARLGQGGYIVEPVGRGEIELGIHQISEILPVKGVKLAGPLPPELQKYTTYVAAPVGESRLALEFIDYLAGPQARALLPQAGYTAPQ
ncbi:MAG TPA: substrate-binding domain-containing protein [Burkholderiales bacterium]|nr:substrate-binding domain-containing protein [Burkholderiales bacterium]